VNDVPTVVHFARLERSATALADETLLDVARRAGAPIGNSCGGVGICARCRVEIVEGTDNLTPPTTIERRTAAHCSFGPDERLACQAVVRGPCRVTTSYW
jgi:ferredoxin